jgi:hypothetical protein
LGSKSWRQAQLLYYGRRGGANEKNSEPDLDHHPVFLTKLGAFLAAAGARYDGNPEFASSTSVLLAYGA